MQPEIIDGDIFKDERGSIAFVNSFRFDKIKRFYLIENAIGNDTRSWHGHKKDIKHFYCVRGSFLISYVKIDNWNNPSKNIPVESTVLNESESRILIIPCGYANSVRSLDDQSRLLAFSILDIEETQDDIVRFPADMW